MEVLKIKAYQLFANYRKPMTFGYWDSYPLPPLSTVKGWFHYVLGTKDYVPASYGITGSYSSIVNDLQKVIKFDKKEKSKDGKPLIEFLGKQIAVSETPTYVVNLFDVHLNIYIKSEKEYLEEFKRKVFQRDYPSLGRREDLLRIDFIDFIELKEEELSIMNRKKIDYGIYLKRETAKSLAVSGINYKIGFKYSKQLMDKTGIRYLEKVDIVYIDSGIIRKGKVLIDKNEDKDTIVDLIGDYNYARD